MQTAARQQGVDVRAERRRSRQDSQRLPAGEHAVARVRRDGRRSTWVHRAGVLLLACAAALLVWMVILGMTLPTQAVARHWSAAWLGLDAMEACGLAATGILMLRRDPRVCAVAGASAALLSADAWFDITTAPLGWDVVLALTLGGLVELPLAALCACIAWTAPRRYAASEHARTQPGRAAPAGATGERPARPRSQRLQWSGQRSSW
jgi:hypothetical protein